MMTLLFSVLMIIVFGKIALFALKATWGLAKIILTIVFLPLTLIGLFISGAVFIAFPLLIIIGLISLIAPN